MRDGLPTLHLLCGKIASGKSTLAKELAAEACTVIISEDDWLSKVFPGEINSVNDYIHRSSSLKKAIGPHVTALLRVGISVVLDFPANTIESRAWMKNLLTDTESTHVLHFLDSTNDECIGRLRARNAQDSHAFVVEDSEFELITSYFVPPRDEEGFYILRH